MSDDFAPHRKRLMAIAYRMLGVRSDAEDAVQETAIKWLSADRSEIRNPEAWLVRTCTRAAIDILRRRKRETYTGPWLPEPTTEDAGEVPALAESLRLAFLLMLERLSPAERAALLLHDVFEMDYDEIAGTLDASEAMARQHVSRARKRIAEDRSRFAVAPAAEKRLMEQFSQTVATGDLAGLTALFARDARLLSDGGGKRRAALNTIYGAEKIARFFLGIADKIPEDLVWVPETLNGATALVGRTADEVFGTISVATDGERITGIYFMRNPDKLTAIPVH